MKAEVCDARMFGGVYMLAPKEKNIPAAQPILITRMLANICDRISIKSHGLTPFSYPAIIIYK